MIISIKLINCFFNGYMKPCARYPVKGNNGIGPTFPPPCPLLCASHPPEIPSLLPL